ncbi:MAG TPA: hypothetical protein VIG68_05190 [Lysobacter sp.]
MPRQESTPLPERPHDWQAASAGPDAYGMLGHDVSGDGLTADARWAYELHHRLDAVRRFAGPLRRALERGHVADSLLLVADVERACRECAELLREPPARLS